MAKKATNTGTTPAASPESVVKTDPNTNQNKSSAPTEGDQSNETPDSEVGGDPPAVDRVRSRYNHTSELACQIYIQMCANNPKGFEPTFFVGRAYALAKAFTEYQPSE